MTFPALDDIVIDHPIKHPGFILAVEDEALGKEILSNYGRKYTHVSDTLWADGSSQQIVHVNDFQHFFQFLSENLIIAQRAQLEKNFKYRQLLPYAPVIRNGAPDITNLDTVEVLTYARLKGGGEPGLHDKESIGFGGHLDISDIVYNDAGRNVPNLLATIMANLRREVLSEELRLIYPEGCEENINLGFTGMILLERNEAVGLVHLGLVFMVTCPSNMGAETPEVNQIGLLGWNTFEHLQANHPKLEGWSRALVDYLGNKARVEREERLNKPQPDGNDPDPKGESDLPRNYGGSGGAGISE